LTMVKQKRGFVVPDTSKRFGFDHSGSPGFNKQTNGATSYANTMMSGPHIPGSKRKRR
jgi:hypothetical protein